MTSQLDAPVTATLRVPGARLYYEVRGRGPLIVLVGAPMNATAFAPLADVLAADYTVLTTDPRGITRSTVDTPDQDSTPELRASDLSRLVAAVDAGPATVFGSSGGAVSALAMAVAYPEQLCTVVAHEPPLEELLEDRNQRRACTDDLIATYVADGPAAAWAKFLADADISMPEGDSPAWTPNDPDPQQVADERFFFLHEMRASTHWRPDLAALRNGATRIVVGLGEDSAGQTCDHTSTALATALAVPVTPFPGNHVGFVADPVGFAAQLRAVLAELP